MPRKVYPRGPPTRWFQAPSDVGGGESEIEHDLRVFEVDAEFDAPAELVLGAATK